MQMYTVIQFATKLHFYVEDIITANIYITT